MTAVAGAPLVAGAAGGLLYCWLSADGRPGHEPMTLGGLVTGILSHLRGYAIRPAGSHF